MHLYVSVYFYIYAALLYLHMFPFGGRSPIGIRLWLLTNPTVLRFGEPQAILSDLQDVCVCVCV